MRVAPVIGTVSVCVNVLLAALLLLSDRELPADQASEAPAVPHPASIALQLMREENARLIEQVRELEKALRELPPAAALLAADAADPAEESLETLLRTSDPRTVERGLARLSEEADRLFEASGVESERELLRVLEIWALKDPAGLAEWLNARDDPRLDSAVGVLAGLLAASGEHPLALGWAESINDGWNRSLALKQIIAHAFSTGKMTVEEVLDYPHLTEFQREDILHGKPLD